MRLHLSLTPNAQHVPFDYQHYLIGAFHKWFGKNHLHDEVSLYSLSWLRGGSAKEGGLDFPHGAEWFLSFWDAGLAKQALKACMNDPDICCGMAVKEIAIQEDPVFSPKEKFNAISPILIRKYENRKAFHLTYREDEADRFLTGALQTKLKAAGLNYKAQVRFDKSYPNPKTKLVKINGIENKANLCPVVIEGDPEAITFAWNVGIGHSTGSCFGAITK